MSVIENFWNEKRVFITGHTGFKGSWLSLWLNFIGADVSGFSLKHINYPNLYDLVIKDDQVNEFRGDVKNYNQLKKAIDQTNPEIIIHMAAQSLVRESYRNPINTIESNIIGTANILDIARATSSVRVIIIVTSDKCYENNEDGKHFIESDSLGGSDVYSSSKAAAELITNSFRYSFFENNPSIGIASVRAGNVIGGGDWSIDRLVPDAMRSFSKKENLEIRSPRATRPWQHVLDPISGYMILCQKLWFEPKKYSEAWNFGPDISSIRNVEDIASSLKKLWGYGANLIVDDKGSLFKESNLLHLNSEKARMRLNWKQKLKIDDALRMTVDWYRNYYNQNKNIKNFSINQIVEYMQNG